MRNTPIGHFWNIKIQYVYSDQNGRLDDFIHQVHYEKIVERLQQNRFTVNKDDIVFLLKEDRAEFDEEFLRIYEPEQDN